MEKLIKRGDVFYANLDGDTYGSERKGTRPVIIVQNNSGNKFSKTVIIVPITKAYHKKSALPTHIILEPSDFIKYKSIILTEQIKTIDKVRLTRKIGTLSSRIMEKLDTALAIAVGINIRKIIRANLFKKFAHFLFGGNYNEYK